MKNRFLKHLLFHNHGSFPSFILLFLLSVVFFSACNLEERYTSSGELRLNLQADNTVNHVTRSGDVVIPLPDTDDFVIIIEKKDGTFADSYDKNKPIPESLTLPIGEYQLIASYGLNGEEGLEAAYFVGKSDFVISENKSTSVEVTCTLENVLVSVKLSDVFVKYFQYYTVLVKSTASGKVYMIEEDSDILYLQPGGFSLILDVTKQNGVSSTYEPVTITTSESRQYYILNIDVNEGNVGGDQLQISFSNDTESEVIEIDLSDEAMNAKEPFFTLTGFQSGEPINIAEGTHVGELSVLMTARGGFKSCVITTQSPFLTTAIWPSPVDLLNMQSAQEVTLKRYGLNWTSSLPQAGVQGSDLKMAVLEFSELIPHLKTVNGQGEHEFTVVVVDQNNKKSEELKLIIHTKENGLVLNTPEPVLIGSSSALFSVEMEGNVQQVEIQHMDAYGVWHSGATQVISSEGNEHVLKATLPVENKPLQVRAKYNSVETPIEYLDVIVPEFSLELENEGDVWATKAYLKLVPEKGGELELIKKYLTVYAGQKLVPVSYESDDIVIISGLSDNTQLTIKATCGKNEYTDDLIINTEAKVELPNGDFENGWSVFYDKTIEQSGKFGRRFITTTWANGGKPLTQNLLVHSLSGWENVNEKTMPDSPAVENTWYIVPSTERTEDAYEGQYAMKLRNVAWDNNGSPIADYLLSSLTTTPSYSITEPQIANRSVGKLFLGNYSYNHTIGYESENYDEGIEFSSRPLSLSGYYIFKDLGNDEGGTVTIIVENNENETIVLAKSSAVLTAVDGYTYFNVPLVYEVNDKKATHLKVMFTSSTKSSYDQQEETTNITTVNRMSVTEAVSTGSELYLDNIQLNYE